MALLALQPGFHGAWAARALSTADLHTMVLYRCGCPMAPVVLCNALWSSVGSWSLRGPGRGGEVLARPQATLGCWSFVPPPSTSCLVKLYRSLWPTLSCPYRVRACGLVKANSSRAVRAYVAWVLCHTIVLTLRESTLFLLRHPSPAPSVHTKGWPLTLQSLSEHPSHAICRLEQHSSGQHNSARSTLQHRQQNQQPTSRCIGAWHREVMPEGVLDVLS